MLLLLACTPAVIDLGGPHSDLSDVGTYTGLMIGRYTWDADDSGGAAGELPCSGELAVTLAADGDLAGSAWCRSDLSEYPLEGRIAGTSTAGVVTGTWTVLYAWTEKAIALQGDVGHGLLTLLVEGDLTGNQHFNGEMSGRQ